MRRLLPEQKHRPAPWIVGLMTFVTLVVGAVGLALSGAVSDLERAAAGRWSLQVTGTPAEAARALAMLRSAPEVASVDQVPEAELRETLRDWLGPAAETMDLPLPALADVAVRDGASGDAVAARVAAAVPSARFVPYASELSPLLGQLRALRWLALGLLLVLAGALAAAVTLAARATLDANRATLDIYHGIGATDAQLLGLLQRRIALDALVGGAAGAIVAVIVLAAATIPARGFLGEVGAGNLLSPSDLVILGALPVVQALLATVVARRALAKALAASP